MNALPKAWQTMQTKRAARGGGNVALRESLREWKFKKAAEKAKRAIINWSAIRRSILERDGFVRRICGCDPCDERMDVHHVDWDRSNNKPRNLVSLCQPCHRAIHQHAYRPDGTDDEPWGDRGPRE